MRNAILMLCATYSVPIVSVGPVVAVEPSASAGERTVSFEPRGLPFRLPSDPQAPVITMTFADPRAAALPAVADLTIFADGRVLATAEAYSPRIVAAQLPPAEWRKVQHELFVENDLLGCHTDTLDDAVRILRRERRRPQPGPDAAVTVLRICGDDFAHEVRCHAVGLTATQLPDLADIQRLYACQQCLQNVVHVVRAGGYEQVNRTLEAINTRLERQLPGCGLLSADDLNLVDARPDGSRYLQFSRLPGGRVDSRSHSGDLQTDERYLMVSVFERPGRPPEISIFGDTAAQ
jgi:hypothetical protein